MKDDIKYSYDLQVWIKDGIIQDCGHPESMLCKDFCAQRRYRRLTERQAKTLAIRGD